MKTQNLIASVAAALLTLASLSAVTSNLAAAPTSVGHTSSAIVTDLAPIQVRPNAADMRHAALLPALGNTDNATFPSLASMDANDRSSEQFNVFGTQLVMPYYSFGNKFGSISKE
ncbi:MAG TPA: hypothetical protein VIL60_14255 [Rhodanobacter sp.]